MLHSMSIASVSTPKHTMPAEKEGTGSESGSEEGDDSPAVATLGFGALLGVGGAAGEAGEGEEEISAGEAEDETTIAESPFAALVDEGDEKADAAQPDAEQRTREAKSKKDRKKKEKKQKALSTDKDKEASHASAANAEELRAAGSSANVSAASDGVHDAAPEKPEEPSHVNSTSHEGDQKLNKAQNRKGKRGKQQERQHSSAGDEADDARTATDEVELPKSSDQYTPLQDEQSSNTLSVDPEAKGSENGQKDSNMRRHESKRNKDQFTRATDSDEVNAMLEGLEMPRQSEKLSEHESQRFADPPPESAGNSASAESDELKLSKAQKRKAKRKQHQTSKRGGDDDVDAVLEELEMPKPSDYEQQQQHEAKQSDFQDVAESTADTHEEHRGEEGKDEEGGDTSKLSKSQKKKQKRKVKQQNQASEAEHSEERQQQHHHDQDDSRAGEKPKTKMSKAARKIHEQMERRKREEEMKRQEEEERKRQEELERQREEEERRKEEERKQRRKEKEKEKKERKRQEGTLLTPKQREEERRLEAVRRQLTQQQQKSQNEKYAEDSGRQRDQQQQMNDQRSSKKRSSKQKAIWSALRDGGRDEAQQRLQQWLDYNLFEGEGGVHGLCMSCETAYSNAKQSDTHSDPRVLHSMVNAVLEAFDVCDWLKDESPNEFGAWRKASFETLHLVKEVQQSEGKDTERRKNGIREEEPSQSIEESEDSELPSWDVLADQAIQSMQQQGRKADVGKDEASADVASDSQEQAAKAQRSLQSDITDSATSVSQYFKRSHKQGNKHLQRHGGEQKKHQSNGSDRSDKEQSESQESSSGDEESDDDEYDELERRIENSRKRRLQRKEHAKEARDRNLLRSPVSCILGHVDTGKTKLLDRVRRTSVQDGEAGGITQQIGATFIPDSAIEQRSRGVDKGDNFSLDVPGLLVIDTPGHESFSNLRSRGSSLCEIAILVVDIMHGLEQQTIESLELLKKRKTPFVIALNKMDRLYNWKECGEVPFREALELQGKEVKREYDQRIESAKLALTEQGLNVALHWENPDPRKYVNIVPTSAITGEGVPDLLHLLTALPQSRMRERLAYYEWPQASVLEVKSVEGHGTTADAILLNGRLREGDTIVVAGIDGPIVTTVRALLTPQPLREMRAKSQYQHHKELQAAQGVKLVAHGLEQAIAGAELVVAGESDEEELLKREAMEDVESILQNIERASEGVHVQASTLGSLEALLSFLRSNEIGIPIAGIGIGPVNKKEVVSTSIMRERGKKEYACILAFDVKIAQEAWDKANEVGVKIFTADIIYHLFHQFSSYIKQVREERRREAGAKADFPCRLKVLPGYVFNKKDPIIVGIEVLEGIVRVGTKLCVPGQTFIELGRVSSIQDNHKDVTTASKGSSVAVKIVPENQQESHFAFGRHFEAKDEVATLMSRKAIETLKAHFKDDLSKEDWKLVVKLKKQRESFTGEVM